MGVKTVKDQYFETSRLTTRYTDRKYARSFLLLGMSDFADDIRLMKSEQRHFLLECVIVIDDDI